MHKLMNAIITEENFRDAWHKVRTNLGAPGVDRVSVEEFERNLEENLALLREIVQDGTAERMVRWL
jgi:retron-type reverse transcriptase